MSKKVLALSGSPRKGGNSEMLYYQLLLGTKESGNEKGIIYGTEAWNKGDIKGSQAMKEAYEMGKNV